MICPQCRTENSDQSSACSKCGSSFDLRFDSDGTLDISPVDTPVSGLSSRGLASSSSGSSSRTGARTAVAAYGVLEAGDELGRYRIEVMLGQGGMGRVYKAYDKELDRPIALKVLQPELSSDPNAMQRFKQELLLASRISHKNILRIHDLGEADGVKFISMAFVDGPDLHHLLHSGKLSIDRAQNIAQQLCEALDAAHSEGIIHRDLKPQNILMGADDHVYVSDFGLAKSLESSSAGMTRTGQYLGTPRYMAPEQVEAGQVDKRTDLYALGLILFEMVTGEDAFKGDSTLQIMYRRVKEKPPNPKQLNQELPDYFSRIILRCLERDPAHRYQDAREILADLRSAHVTPAAKGLSAKLAETSQLWWLAAAAIILVAVLASVPSVRHIFRPASSSTISSKIAPPAGVPPISSGKFIAVLPLQVLGDTHQLGYLAEGIQEALSAKLFQLKDVRVTSSDATSRINQTESLAQLGSALGANLLVQGMLQGSGDQIRVIINLEDAADGKRLWSKEFNGVTGDLFTIEDQIYNQLVSALNLNPSGDEMARAAARPTDNVAAYDVYLRGRNSLRNSQDPKSIQAALDYFNDALKQDPKFALAYTGIADASLRMYHLKKDSFWTEKALAAAQQAEQLNDRLSEVHIALGNVYSANGKYAEAIAELKQALALSPNSESAYRLIGDVYMQSGDSSKAIAAYQKCIDLDPYYWFNQNILGNAYFRLGDYQKALAAYNKVTQMNPDNATGYDMSGMVLAQEGNYQASIPAFQKAISISPDWTAYTNLGTAYFLLKQYSQAADMYAKAVQFDPNNEINIGNLADAYRFSGQLDKARSAYQQAISLAYKQLQTNPQDADVMEHLGQYYAKTGDGAQAETFIRRARALQPSNVGHIYSDAEIEAILGNKRQALKLLEAALKRNYPAEYAAADPDMKNLQSNPAFASLLKEYAKKK